MEKKYHPGYFLELVSEIVDTPPLYVKHLLQNASETAGLPKHKFLIGLNTFLANQFVQPDNLNDVTVISDIMEKENPLSVNMAFEWLHNESRINQKEVFKETNTPEKNPQADDMTGLMKPKWVKILPKLVSMYRDARKEDFALLVFAMKDLNLLSSNALTNQTRLFDAMKKTFGSIGSRQNFVSHLKKLEAASSYEQDEIAAHRARIKGLT